MKDILSQIKFIFYSNTIIIFNENPLKLSAARNI